MQHDPLGFASDGVKKIQLGFCITQSSEKASNGDNHSGYRADYGAIRKIQTKKSVHSVREKGRDCNIALLSHLAARTELTCQFQWPPLLGVAPNTRCLTCSRVKNMTTFHVPSRAKFGPNPL